MCVVSAVHDYGQKLWPDVTPWVNPMPMTPSPVPTPDISELLKRIEIGKNADKPMIKIINPEEALAPKDDQPRLPTAAEIKAFKKLVEAAERFDEIAKQAHCEDPEKVKLMAQLDERLARIEEAVGVQALVEAPAPPHPATLKLAQAIYEHMSGHLGASIPIENIIDHLSAQFEAADVTEARRRADAAYSLLHEN